MADLKFEKEFTGLLLIDPYNDFISEGSKIWDRIKSVAEANDCVPHMLRLLNSSRKIGLGFSMRCIIDTVRATTKPGSRCTNSESSLVAKDLRIRHLRRRIPCQFAPQPGDM